MMYVLLQLKNYTIIVKATSDKHWRLVDNGADEICSGSWYDCLQRDREMNIPDPELIELKTPTSLIQTSEECLTLILKLNPDYLNDKTFVE